MKRLFHALRPYISGFVIVSAVGYSLGFERYAESATFDDARDRALARGSVKNIQALSCPSTRSESPAHSAWLRTSRPNARGVVLLAHGLNVLPEKMDSIAQTLNEDGFDVFRAALSGHRGDEADFKKVDRARWILDLFEAYCGARQEANSRGLVLHFVGYSLGALVNLDLMNSGTSDEVRYERMALFAPAIAVNWTSHLVRALKLFGEEFLVPSAANSAYRANQSGTPVAAYSALFASIRAIQEKGLRASRAPSLVLIDPQDELVNSNELKQLVTLNGLNEWKVIELSNQESTLEHGAYHHLIIDEPSLGPSEWNRVRTLLREHFADRKG